MDFVAYITLNLRKAPSFTAPVVQALENADCVTVLQATNSEWVKVRTFISDNTRYIEGYIASKYLTSKGNIKLFIKFLEQAQVGYSFVFDFSEEDFDFNPKSGEPFSYNNFFINEFFNSTDDEIEIIMRAYYHKFGNGARNYVYRTYFWGG